MRWFLRIGTVVFVFAHIFMWSSPALAQPKKEVKKGNVLYNEGKFKEALKQYEEALLKSPDSDIVNFNLGAALYKTDDYKAALRHFEKAMVSEDKSLEQKASYNMGNAEYKYGISRENENLDEAVTFLKRALGHYENAILLDSEDEDAKFNYEFVKKELERLLKKKKEKKREERKKKLEEKEKKPEPETAGGKRQEKEKKEESEQERKEQVRQERGEGREMRDEKEAEGKEKHSFHQTLPPSRPIGEMSKEEAEMLLEQYRYEEEPKGLYRKKIPTAGFPEVLKDW